MVHKILILLGVAFVLLACQKRSTTTDTTAAGPGVPETNTTEGPRYLYVASGTCYAGGVATAAGSATVVRYNLSSKTLESVVVDYASYSPGDLPASIADYDSDSLLVAIENPSFRRIDLVQKSGMNEVVTHLSNSSGFTTALKSLTPLSDGGLLISKTSAIEKFGSNKARITQGANPYINAPAAPCATSTTLITSTEELPGGNLLFAHAAASPNNKIGIISAAGYAAAPDCKATQVAPATTALPTSLLMHSSGKLLVAYGSTAAASNVIYSYQVAESPAAFSNATSVYANVGIVNGPSAIAEDSTATDVFIANGASSANTIERFQYDTNQNKLIRVGTSEVVPKSVYTRCITSMFVSN